MAYSVSTICMVVLLLLCLMSELIHGCGRRRCSTVNCEVGAWTPWSCSEECGGGRMTRSRRVVRSASCSGMPCGKLSEEKNKACNTICYNNGRYVNNKCQCLAGYAQHRCCKSTAGSCGNIEIVSRSEWGARQPKMADSMSTPAPYIFIHHTVDSSCSSKASCSATCRSIQNYHMDDRGWNDIGYSFLIGEDGRAYEGRGWGTQGAHTLGYNTNAHGISVIGTFTSKNPNQLALNAINALIDCGMAANKIRSNYKLGGHRDVVVSTACPGNYFYDNWITNHGRWDPW